MAKDLLHFKNERGEVTITQSTVAKKFNVTAVFGGKTYTDKFLRKRAAENLYWKYWYKFNEKR